MGFFRDEGKVYKPVKELDLSPDSTEPYIEAHVKVPRMAGFVIKIFTWLLELRAFGTMVVYFLKRQNLIHKLVTFAMLEEPPVFVPFHSSEDLKEQEVKSIQPDLSPSEKVEQAIDCLPLCSKPILAAQHGFKRWTIQDYSRAYISRETTPLLVTKDGRNLDWSTRSEKEKNNLRRYIKGKYSHLTLRQVLHVATRFLAAIHESSNSPLEMSFFINYSSEDILKQATESTRRYELGTPISILDGVPIAIKDEIDCMPYPTTGGTKWLQKFRPCTDDACCVKHLRLCGAILVGKSNMHELGTGTSGINPHYGVTRNPYDSKRISGGSSSGSAALVSAGLCPAALGVDGGGSVRMPAALCGVVGLKPSFGRVSHLGVLPLNWTVGMVGILAATIEDAFILYAAISSHLPSNQPTSLKPKINFPLLKSKISISNIKMAMYKEWFNDCNDEIKNCCYEALDKLCKNYAWKIVEVTIPDIETMRLAHYITIGSECTTSMASLLETLKASELGWDARVALRVYGSFSSKDYLNAQRIRNRQMHIHKDIFKSADVIVTPTTGVTAYPITETAVKYGEFDYVNGAALVRYQIAGNFLGLPAVTVPVGYDKVGMPIGLQFIGRPFSEATLIHISYAMQALYISSCQKPKVFYDLLSKQ